MPTSALTATTENFMTDVVEASASMPVLVDFWAPWCGPCKQLEPLLDRVLADYDGRVRFAKVNTDEQPQLAGQLGIRSLPTVALFKDKAVVDHFMGVVPEGQIRQMLERHVPQAAASPLEQARALKAAGDIPAARAVLAQALGTDATNVELKVELAELAVLQGELEEARSALTALQAKEPAHRAVKRLEALLRFSDVVVAHPDANALRTKVQANPADFDSVHALAVHELLAGDYAAALSHWLDIMRRDRKFRDDLARKSLVMAFDLIGESEAAVSEARRRMAQMLF